MQILRADALEYHRKARPGKIAIAVTKPCATQRDLSLAYTPGVAEPVREIHADPAEAFARELLDIPVFHDDQHGTAIITAAGLLNALELTGKRIEEVRTVISGAGAAAIASAEFFIKLGMRREHIALVDTKGVVYPGRTERMNQYKERLAAHTSARTLADALACADVFVGLSVAGIVSREMVRTMAERPIIFALANPDPEIAYNDARAARPDAIVASGRSDDPNQVNNVLGFPFIFRGALDVRARSINDEMKIAAARALAALAKEEVPDVVLRAYGIERLRFGADCILPKPVDPRVPLWVAPAVAEAAMASGVARRTVDPASYREELARRLRRGWEVMGTIVRKAQASPARVVSSEGEEPRIIRAAAVLAREGIAHPILLGRDDAIRARMQGLGISFSASIVAPADSPNLPDYAAALYEARRRKGVTLREARALVQQPNYFGAMMVRSGDADAFVAGLAYHYPDVIRPALHVIGPEPGVSRVAGLYLLVRKDRPYLLADPTVNVDPTAEELAEIAVMAAEKANEFNITPRIAMLSFSNFGSTRHPRSAKVAEATALVRARRPDLMVDGEIMADVALSPELRQEDYPFSTLAGEANVLIFPSLEAANTAYKLLQRLGGATAVGPILMGMAKPVHVLSRGAEVTDIVNIAAIAVVDAQNLARLSELSRAMAPADGPAIPPYRRR